VWFPACYTYLIEYVVKPGAMKLEPDQSVIDAQAPRWNELAAILEDQLSKTKWIAGDELTIADIAVAAVCLPSFRITQANTLSQPMHVHALQRLPLEKYPNLKRWMTEGVEKLPSWQKTQEAVDKALSPGAEA